MAAMRFAIRFKNIMPNFAYHHLMMMFIIFATTVSAILLAGAGSTSIAHHVYLVQFSYLNSNQPPSAPPGSYWENITLPAFDAVKDTHLGVRVGYFGICAKENGESWICRKSRNELMASHQYVDPLGVMGMADKVRADVMFPGLLLGSVGLALLSLILFNSFPGWHEERDMVTGSDVDVKPFPSRQVLMACLACTGLASLFTFTSALWQHTAAATAATVLETSAVSLIKGSVGSAGTALAWLICGIWILSFIGTLVMWLSILILARLTDDD